MGETFAAIDIGSNAVRLKVARARRDGSLATVHREREPLPLGDDVFIAGAVSRFQEERLLALLRRFRETCRAHGAAVRAVATSALRDAANGRAIAARAGDAATPFEILSGAEEARLTLAGAAAGSAPGHRMLVIDVGGGSTEIGVAVGGTPAHAVSLDLGTARLADLDAPALRRRVDELLDGVGALDGAPPHAVCTSGALRALIDFAAPRGASCVDRARLACAVDVVLRLGPVGRRRCFGRRRAERMPAAAIALDAIGRRLAVDTFAACKRGLRDGVLAEMQATGYATGQNRESLRPVA